MSAPLAEDIALRIGLASRQLPDIKPEQLLRVLFKVMGEPINASKLNRLRAKRFRTVGNELFNNVTDKQFEAAFALLKGRGVDRILYPKPTIASGVYCELHGFVRVACASNCAEDIDGAFISCARFLIYQVSPDYIRLIDIREPKKPQNNRDRSQLRAKMLADCELLYTTSIGAAAAAKVVKVGLHPIKLAQPTAATQALERLREVLSSDCPPPWLAKAMGHAQTGVRLYGENV